MSGQRLLVIGWDAADWKVIRPLMKNGEMPNLAKLMSQGGHGNIATIYPALSPMLWTTISTGKRAYKHGIHGFTEATEDGMSVRPISNLSRTAKTFWNIFNQTGGKSIVAGWWPSHPAEPIRGAMVSDHFPYRRGQAPETPLLQNTVSPALLQPELADLRVHPMELTGDILRMFVPRFSEVDQDKDKSLHDLANIVAETMSIHCAFTDLMEREETADWQLGAVYFCGIDHFSHRFMRYHAGKARQRGDVDPGLYAEVVQNAYRYHDVMLGRLLQLAGENCSIVLLSDHGFHSDALLPDYIPPEAAGPAVEHRHYGILCVRAPGVPAGSQIYGASVLDITPTILHILGLPAGADMDGKVLINAFPGQKERPRIASWEGVPGEDGRHPPTTRYDSLSAAESLKQLVELGYIEPLSGNAAENVRRTVTENKYNLARASLDAGRVDIAVPLLRELVAQEPEQGRFHLHLIETLLQNENYDACREALDAFDAACAAFAPRAAEELKRRVSEQKESQEAEEDDDGPARKESRIRRELAEKAAGFGFERIRLRVKLLLARRGNAEEREMARELVHQLLAKRGTRANRAVDLFLGETLLALSETDRSLECLRRALRANAEDHHTLALVARAQFAARHFDKAVEAAVDSLALVYHQPRLHHLLGRALERMGDFERAEQCYRVALAQYPSYAAAHRSLARLLRRDPAKLGEASLHMAQAHVARDAQVKKRAEQQAAALLDAVEPALAVFHEAEDLAPPADRSRVITIVSGLPRSGTSMMMQLLAAGGVEPHTDGRREADEDNPRGYFEHELATRVHADASWLPQARGKVVKIVAQLLPHLPAGEEYRVVFMHRDLDEVIASQQAMLKRLGRTGAQVEARRLARAYSGQLVKVQEWARRTPGVHVLGLKYAEVLENPWEAADRVAAFVGEPFLRNEAARAVDPSLRRQKAVAV